MEPTRTLQTERTLFLSLPPLFLYETADIGQALVMAVRLQSHWKSIYNKLYKARWEFLRHHTAKNKINTFAAIVSHKLWPLRSACGKQNHEGVKLHFYVCACRSASKHAFCWIKKMSRTTKARTQRSSKSEKAETKQNREGSTDRERKKRETELWRTDTLVGIGFVNWSLLFFVQYIQSIMWRRRKKRTSCAAESPPERRHNKAMLHVALAAPATALRLPDAAN